MYQDKISIVKYQDNFADNLSSLAYAKILQEKFNTNYYFENNPKLRNNFEKMMKNFNMEYEYISVNKVEQITKQSFLMTRYLTNNSKKNKLENKNNIVDFKFFNISNIDLISEKIKKEYSFSNHDFIINYDILENITTTNSIGIYLNKKDMISSAVDFNYINKAINRLNKYIKSPKIYIFTDKNLKLQIDKSYKYTVLDLHNWQEEFYFLQNCKHKIIINAKNSYSENLWASILNEKEYNLIVFDKNLCPKLMKRNWIGI